MNNPSLELNLRQFGSMDWHTSGLEYHDARAPVSNPYERSRRPPAEAYDIISNFGASANDIGVFVRSHGQSMRQSVQAAAMTDDGELTNQKIAAAEARTDAKFEKLVGKIDTTAAELHGDMKAIAEKIAAISVSTRGVKTTVIVTGIAVVTLVVAVLAYGSQWFGLGITARDIADQSAKNAVEQVLHQIRLPESQRNSPEK